MVNSCYYINYSVMATLWSKSIRICILIPSAGDRQSITHIRLMFSFLFPIRFPFLTGRTHSSLCSAVTSTRCSSHVPHAGADMHWKGWVCSERVLPRAHLVPLPPRLGREIQACVVWDSLLNLSKSNSHQQQRERKQIQLCVYMTCEDPSLFPGENT